MRKLAGDNLAFHFIRKDILQNGFSTRFKCDDGYASGIQSLAQLLSGQTQHLVGIQLSAQVCGEFIQKRETL